MTTQELIDYNKAFKESHKTPEVKIIEKMTMSAAGKETSNRKAVGGIPWIDYYRAFVDPTKVNLR